MIFVLIHCESEAVLENLLTGFQLYFIYQLKLAIIKITLKLSIGCFRHTWHSYGLCSAYNISCTLSLICFIIKCTTSIIGTILSWYQITGLYFTLILLMKACCLHRASQQCLTYSYLLVSKKLRILN